MPLVFPMTGRPPKIVGRTPVRWIFRNLRVPLQRLLPPTGLNRLMSARFNAVARRVAEDHTGPFWTMRVRTARAFVPTGWQPPDVRPDEAFWAFSGKTTRTKRRNEADPSDTERFVKRTTGLKDWPV